MRTPLRIAATVAALVLASPAFAAQTAVSVSPAKDNPAAPVMGDHLAFHSTIRNVSRTPIDGLVAWISLVRVDAGNEQPVDLEDWSAHKVVTAGVLAPDASIETDWPMRLIQAGKYRVVISVASRDGADLDTSNFADFSVRQKAVVESARILPVAIGIPLLIAGLIVWRWQRRGSSGAKPSARRRTSRRDQVGT